MSNEQELQSVEQYKFEPIKGYPMLRWKGYRPYTSTQYYPAQLKEFYGEPDESGWINKIFWGDNLQVMSHLLKKYRGQIKLVYIDPPFDSKADYKKKIKLKGKNISNDLSLYEEKQYSDIWSNDEYLQFMYERLILLRELLSDDGSIWVHCDWRKSHYLKIMLDEIFGPDSFKGHVTWRSMTSSGFKGKTSLGKSHDDLLYYSKSSNNYIYNPVMIPYSKEYIEERFNKIDETGRRFKDEKIGTATSDETIKRLKAEGRIYYTSTGTPRIKHFLDESTGYPADDIWTDIFGENSQSKNLTNYPTQKPEALLERIINMCSNEGDMVFDCFMGSGTTQAVAMKLNRRFIGADINLGSIQVTSKRLVNVMEQLKINVGFEVYNVNNYDIFRNPLEAKELLKEILEIQDLGNNRIFDGEKDGYMVKVMPINRITTKADLNELITNLDYKLYELRQSSNPNEVVENILLICMGHESDLAATLVKEIPFKIKVEVVDILRDRSNIEFKRDSEVEIKIINNQLIINNFYPMNLLQKLSIMKESVNEWKELVESIMIDWNYDGAILNPTVIDVPDKGDLVSGIYDIPNGIGTIRVKITDLLSESLEVSIENE